jgi:hypothetical protein
MVFSVHNFFKKYKSEKQLNKLEFSKCQDVMAEPHGVSTLCVSTICRWVKILKDHDAAVFVSLERAPTFQGDQSRQFERDVCLIKLFYT